MSDDINLDPLKRAKAIFDKIMVEPESEIIRDAAIKRFEFTIEIAWKTIKKIMNWRGIEANSPKQIFRLAASQGIVDDLLVWFDFVDMRNETAHTYNEDTSQSSVQETKAVWQRS